MAAVFLQSTGPGSVLCLVGSVHHQKAQRHPHHEDKPVLPEGTAMGVSLSPSLSLSSFLINFTGSGYWNRGEG